MESGARASSALDADRLRVSAGRAARDAGVRPQGRGTEATAANYAGMRLATMLLVLAGAVALSVLLYILSGGRLIVFALPLVLAGPFVWRGRRS